MGDLDRRRYLRHRYGGNQRLVDWRERTIVAELLESVDRPLERILDAPSGHGRFVPLLRATGARVIAADRDRRHLAALAAAEQAAGAPEVPLARVDLLAPLPLRDDAVDLVFCFRFAQHVRDPALLGRLLGELARVSRRYVLLSYYATGSLHGLQRRLLRLRPGDRRGPLGVVAPRALAELARVAGLRVVAERAPLPGIHAQRVALLERAGPAAP